MSDILNFLASNAPSFVIDDNFEAKDYCALDLSVTNADLEGVDMSSSDDLGDYIDKVIKKNAAKVAIGGYLERRNIYARSTYFKAAENAKDERNIHLGIDIWAPEGTEVLAALNGEIHSFKNNLNHGDYGPTIILKHVIKDLEFYSLYGHLSLNSIEDIELGQKIEKGEIIGSLGGAEVNGDYAPHLHFQIILEIGDYFGDYPGVCSENDLESYKKNCPDPNLLLRLGIL